MSISGKKFSWKNVSNFLTDKQLKSVLGGSGGAGIYLCKKNGEEGRTYKVTIGSDGGSPCEADEGYDCCYNVLGKLDCGTCP